MGRGHVRGHRQARSAQLNVAWERRPAPGRVSTDTALLLGVDYTW